MFQVGWELVGKVEDMFQLVDQVITLTIMTTTDLLSITETGSRIAIISTIIVAEDGGLVVPVVFVNR